MSSQIYRWSVGAAAILTAAVAAFLICKPASSTTPNTTGNITTAVAANALAMFDDPNEFALPNCTVVVQLLTNPGYIVSAVEPKEEEPSEEADLKTVGTPKIDGTYRGNNQAVDWGDTVESGAITNAGAGMCQIVFESRLIVDLQPGDSIFISSTLTETEIAAQLEATLSHCYCRCTCTCNGNGETHYIACSEAGPCHTVNGDTCENGSCTNGTMSGCTKVWKSSCEP